MASFSCKHYDHYESGVYGGKREICKIKIKEIFNIWQK